MTEEQKAAYVISQSIAALAEIEGMKADNMQRDVEGNSMAFRQKDFQDLIERYGIHHNGVIGLFRGV